MRNQNSDTGRLWATLKRRLKRGPKLSRTKLADFAVREARKIGLRALLIFAVFSIALPLVAKQLQFLRVRLISFNRKAPLSDGDISRRVAGNGTLYDCPAVIAVYASGKK
jgi:hypothetical protein